MLLSPIKSNLAIPPSPMNPYLHDADQVLQKSAGNSSETTGSETQESKETLRPKVRNYFSWSEMVYAGGHDKHVKLPNLLIYQTWLSMYADRGSNLTNLTVNVMNPTYCPVSSMTHSQFDLATLVYFAP